MTNKKEKILLTALELFANEGFKSVTTSKIAKEAGVSEGLIFRHFENKKGLLNALRACYSHYVPSAPNSPLTSTATNNSRPHPITATTRNNPQQLLTTRNTRQRLPALGDTRMWLRTRSSSQPAMTISSPHARVFRLIGCRGSRVLHLLR